jgi:hypothetical protein
LIEIERALAIAPAEPLVRYWKALARIGLGQLAGAEVDLHVSSLYLGAADPTNRAWDRLWTAILRRALGRNAECYEELGRCRSEIYAIEEIPVRARLMGLLSVVEGRSEDARAHLTAAIDLKPNLTSIRNTRLYLRLLCHVFAGDACSSDTLDWLDRHLELKC